MAETDSLPPLRDIGDHIEGHTVVGSEVLKLVPLTKMNRVAQARRTYDEDDMEELKESLKFPLPDGKTGIKLVQTPTIVYYPKDEAHQYVEKANRMFDAGFDPDNLIPIRRGANGFVIVLAGHRRSIALNMVAPEVGTTPGKIDVVSQVEPRDTTFRDAIAIQYRENLHKRLPPDEDAAVINAFLREGLREGDYQGFADCARGLGVRPERVSRAFRFQTLPEPIRELVRERTLHFERAILLSRLCVVLAYRELEDDKKSEFEQRFLTKTLYLPDIHPYLPGEMKTSLDGTYMWHAANLAGLGSNGQAHSYIKNEVTRALDDGQLSFIEVTEAELLKEREREEMYGAYDLAASSLRTIAALLKRDAQRVKDGKSTTLERTRRGAQQMRAINKALEASKSPDKYDEEERLEIIKEGTNATIELAQDSEEARDALGMDFFSASMTD